MTQATLVEPVEKFKTCLDCPHFRDFNEPEYLQIGEESIPNRHRKGFGWCQLFDDQAKAHSQMIRNCINTSKVLEEKEREEKQYARHAKPKPILRDKAVKTYRVIKTWDNRSSFSAGRVISVLVQPSDYSTKPFWDSVMLSQGIKRNDILIKGRGDYLIKIERTKNQSRLT